MPKSRHKIAALSARVPQLESLPQAVVAFGRDLAAGESLPLHHHRRAQLVYASRGIMTVSTPQAAYVVPPQRAVWMPGGVAHRIDARSEVSMRTLYIETDQTAGLPSRVCVLKVTPLLRELVLAAVAAGPVYEPDSPQARLMAVIVDQIRTQPEASLSLPMPRDSRLLHVVGALVKDPADPRDLAAWARTAGASERTLSRLFRAETDMSFRAWRTQCRLLRALELLTSGQSVTSVAADLGYDSSSAFIAMFKRTLGTTPSRYLHAELDAGAPTEPGISGETTDRPA